MLHSNSCAAGIAGLVFGLSLIVAIGAVAFGLIFGGSLGLVAGYFRGKIDTGLTAIFNILLAIQSE